MATQAQFEYRVTYVDDDCKEVDAQMLEWAEAGWELVSGSSSSWASSGFEREHGHMTRWHTRFTTYWRKPRTTE